MDSTGFCARLPRHFRRCRRAIQDHRLLLAAARARAAVERPRSGNQVAGQGSRAERTRSARHAAASGRSISLRILITGKDGQVGWELQRALPALGEVVSTGREDLDLGDADAVQRKVREVKPDLIVNAVAYTAVDKAESEPGLAMRVNGIAPGVLA